MPQLNPLVKEKRYLHDDMVVQIARARLTYIQIVELYNQLEANKEMVRNTIKNMKGNSRGGGTRVVALPSVPDPFVIIFLQQYQSTG